MYHSLFPAGDPELIFRRRQQIPRLNFKGICLQDSPVGVRFADFVSVFPAGINAAATWDENLIYRRGVAMGEEFRGKGVNVALAPMMNLARAPAAGRNWEGCKSRLHRTDCGEWD